MRWITSRQMRRALELFEPLREARYLKLLGAKRWAVVFIRWPHIPEEETQ